MRFELETRFKQIQSRLKAVSDETEEVLYTIQALKHYSYVCNLDVLAFLNKKMVRQASKVEKKCQMNVLATKNRALVTMCCV